MLDRFSAASLAILDRAGRWAAAEGAKAIDTAHIVRALERPSAPSGRAVTLWTPDAKRTLKRALSLSARRKGAAVEASDIRRAIATSQPAPGSQTLHTAASPHRRVTPGTQASVSSGAPQKPTTRAPVRPPRNSSSQGREKRQAKSFKWFRPSRLRPIGPSLVIAALVIALAAVGLSFLSPDRA